MRPLLSPVFLAFTLPVLCPGLAHADFVRVFESDQDCCFYPFYAEPGASFVLWDLPGATFASSNPSAWWVSASGPSAGLGVTPGALIGNAGNTLIYAPGTVALFGGLSTTKIPIGTSCAEFGWPPPPETGSCLIEIGLAGTTGEITAKRGDIVQATPDGYLFRDLEVTTRVTFNITPDLAFALGITTGPYFGSFVMLGKDFDFAAPGSHGIGEYDWIEVNGSTIPEPASLILLGTAVAGLAFVVKRRFR